MKKTAAFLMNVLIAACCTSEKPASDLALGFENRAQLLGGSAGWTFGAGEAYAICDDTY